MKIVIDTIQDWRDKEFTKGDELELSDNFIKDKGADYYMTLILEYHKVSSNSILRVYNSDLYGDVFYLLFMNKYFNPDENLLSKINLAEIQKSLIKNSPMLLSKIKYIHPDNKDLFKLLSL